MGVLRDHLGIPPDRLVSVFPSPGRVAIVEGLLRT
jgi:hypothetical protein